MEGSDTKSILVVEDEKDIADLIEHHLKQSGFYVLKAIDGSSGLETAKKERPSLMILESDAPWDGWEGLRNWRGQVLGSPS